MSPEQRFRAKNIDPDVLGARLREARQRAGLTQGEAAGDDMSTAYISRIEAGHRRGNPDLLARLAGRLGVDLDDLLRPEEPDAAAQLVARLSLELDYVELDLRTGAAEQALTRVMRVLEEPDVPPDVERRGYYLKALALEAGGRLDDAVVVLEDAVGSFPPGVSLIQALIALSRCYREEGDLARACEVGERAEALLDDAALRGTAEGVQLAVTVAAAFHERGDVHHALRLCRRAVESAEQLDSPTARASAYWNSSIVHSRAGDVDAALPLAQKAIALLEQGNDARNMARLRLQLGVLQLQLDPPELDGAVLNFNRARDEMDWNDASALDRSRVQLGLARARLLIGETEEAQRLAEDCLTATAGISPLAAAEARTLSGRALIAAGRVEEAVEQFRHAILELSAVGADRGAAQLWFELGGLLQEHGAVSEALDAFRRAAASTGLTQPSFTPKAVSTS
ncbi:hypothetical protein GCM10023340_24040 [Nocardioides marinquilinus]|uniref:HTH cro/C1-type domain-containing protein n=1 Tax=Nocardioides marinquilinus TaxID=1210400 RepID=A0ABP9PMK9_9ACTN